MYIHKKKGVVPVERHLAGEQLPNASRKTPGIVIQLVIYRLTNLFF